MAYTVEFITELNDTDFNRLFDDSIDNLNSGTYPWENTPVADGNNEAKRVFIKAAYQNFLDEEIGVVIKVAEDGHALFYAAGFLESRNFLGHMVLMGRNVAGSKSWLYDDNYHTAWHLFTDAEFDTFEYQTVGAGTEFHDMVINEYNRIVETQPDWYKSTGAVPGGEDIAGAVTEGSANTTMIPEHETRTDTLGNYRLKMTGAWKLNDDTGIDGEFESEDDPERLQWEAGTHPDQNPTE